MKHRPGFTWIPYIIGFVILLAVLAAAFIIFTIKLDETNSTAPLSGTPAKSVKSQFSFGGAEGWRQGPSNKTSMAFFNSNGCFTSVENKTGTLDIAAEQQKNQTTLTGAGYTVTPAGTQTLTMQTSAGPKQYELQQSSVTTPAGTTPVEGGQEFGYLQLADGYIKIMGYCDTADELPVTIPALQAVRFDTTK